MLQEDTGTIRKARRVKRSLIAAATALPLSLAGVTGAQAANDVIIGAHEAGSTFYVVGAAVADVVSKNSKYTGKLLTVAGAAVWMPMMDSREVDLGVVSHYEGWLARNGRKPFAKEFDIRTVVVGGGINVGLYVRKDSDIRKLSDIRGDTIFASMYEAYDALSDRMKTHLEGLTALHDGTRVFGGTPRNRIIPLLPAIRKAGGS